MKRTLVSAIMIGGLIMPVAGAFAEDVDDVTMQVVGPEATPDAVTQRIELPAQVSEEARENAAYGLETANENAAYGLETANQQREEIREHRKEMREQREEMNQEMRQEQYEFQQQISNQRGQ